MEIRCTPSELKELLNNREEVIKSRARLKKLLEENAPSTAINNINNN